MVTINNTENSGKFSPLKALKSWIDIENYPNWPTGQQCRAMQIYQTSTDVPAQEYFLMQAHLQGLMLITNKEKHAKFVTVSPEDMHC